MHDAQHPDARMRWYGERLEVLTREFPIGGAEHVSALLGDASDDIRWAAAYFGIEHGKRPAHQVFSLTERELRTLRAFASGSTARQVAEQMQLSVHTVNDHIGTVFRKMGVSTMVAATLKAERAGLLDGVTPVTVQRWEKARQGQAPQAKTQPAQEEPTP